MVIEFARHHIPGRSLFLLGVPPAARPHAVTHDPRRKGAVVIQAVQKEFLAQDVLVLPQERIFAHASRLWHLVPSAGAHVDQGPGRRQTVVPPPEPAAFVLQRIRADSAYCLAKSRNTSWGERFMGSSIEPDEGAAGDIRCVAEPGSYGSTCGSGPDGTLAAPDDFCVGVGHRDRLGQAKLLGWLVRESSDHATRATVVRFRTSHRRPTSPAVRRPA